MKHTAIDTKLKAGPVGLRFLNELCKGGIDGLPGILSYDRSSPQEGLVFLLLLELPPGDPEVSALLQISWIGLVSHSGCKDIRLALESTAASSMRPANRFRPDRQVADRERVQGPEQEAATQGAEAGIPSKL
jgi:hypothetical protein